MYWFRYPDQAIKIAEAIKRSGKKIVRIANLGIWNGEESFSLAIMLRKLIPAIKCEIIGIDAVLPRAEDLTWVDVELIPFNIPKEEFFRQVCEGILELKPEFYNLVTLKEGNILEKEGIPEECDIVVINNLLGLDISEVSQIRRALEMICISLKEGGYLFIDKRYCSDKRKKEILESVLDAMVKNCILKAEADDIYCKIKKNIVKEG